MRRGLLAMGGRGLLALGAFAGTALLRGAPLQAHAFGARYDLPLPLDLYMIGAAAAVVLSFLVMALVFRAKSGGAGRWRFDLLRFAPARALLHPFLRGLLQAIAVGLFALVLASGFFGSQDTIRNFAPSFVWIVWWVGLAYVAALLGNLWPLVNPWSAVFAVWERLRHRFARPADLGLAYPPWLGAWPAVLLFGLFAWLELISETARVPATLAGAILLYSLVTWAGMAAFGRRTWLAEGEAFSLAFGVLGRFAPLAAPTPGKPGMESRHWYLRPYGADLVVTAPCRFSLTVFILVMLATVTFDGFMETSLWGQLLQAIATLPALHGLLRAVHDLGFDFQPLIETLVLCAFPLLFLAVYLAVCRLSGLAAGSSRPTLEIAGLFVLTLVPIAIAYHLAHYLSYLAIAGQYIIPLISDPFGFGWDLFGTAGYKVDITLVGAKFIWYSALTAIVLGHVLAVGVAHFVALKAFGSLRAALRSQLPFLLLMVGYTVVSLWILAQPIVGSPGLSTLRAPSGRLVLEPFAFRELCLELTTGQGIAYEFRSEHPLEFDIHYHQGLAIRFPVQMASVREQAARFLAPRNQSYCLMWFNRGLAPSRLTYRLFRPS